MSPASALTSFTLYRRSNPHTTAVYPFLAVSTDESALFSSGMDRETKRNLLLLYANRAEILRRLRERHPKGVRRYDAEIQYKQE